LSYRPQVDRTLFKASKEPVVAAEVQKSLDELPGKYDAIEKKFNDGDLTDAEKKAELRTLDTQKDTLNRQILLDTSERNESEKEAWAKDQEWRSEQMRFFDARATDYDPKSMKGRAVRGALNNTLIALSEDPKNSSKTGMAMLVLAHKELLKSLGVADVKPEPNPKTKAEDKKPDAPLPDIKTLTDLPIAEQNES